MDQTLTHVNEKGEAHMVDVSEKDITHREASAQSTVRMRPETLALIVDERTKKGDVFAAARIAGILAAKRTWELIPLCHNIPIETVTVDLMAVPPDCVRIVASACCNAKTGIEMEVLTAASVAALTVYDMLKAVDRGMRITDVMLLHKSGGNSGDYAREADR
ncbi:MAG: cyclic pyranopterin monophosphate synthase MoaC [Clostridia bacterium]